MQTANAASSAGTRTFKGVLYDQTYPDVPAGPKQLTVIGPDVVVVRAERGKTKAQSPSLRHVSERFPAG